MSGSTTSLIVKAPGRINIIGEHTDYNGGLALPAAAKMKLTMYMRIVPGKTIWEITAEDRNQKVLFRPDERYSGKAEWMGFFSSMARHIQKRGLPYTGLRISFKSDIPVGAGMSSSSALSCAIVAGMNCIFDWKMDRLSMVKLASEVEHGFGVRGGMLDQMAIFYGKAEHALRIDFSTMEFEYIHLQTPGYSWVLWDSLERRDLVRTPFNDRRNIAASILKQLSKKHWQEVSTESLKGLKNVPDSRMEMCRYILEENRRVDACIRHLKESNFEKAGQLLYASHEGLRSRYRVSSSALDRIVEHLEKFPECAGARMMGGGFGGMVISLIRTDAIAHIAGVIRRIPGYFPDSRRYYYIIELGGGLSLQG